MLTHLMRSGSKAACCRNPILRAALVLGLLCLPSLCAAQTTASDDAPAPIPIPTQTPILIANDSAQAPLTERERAMLELIKNLQERVTRLEAAQTSAPKPTLATTEETEAPPSTTATAKSSPQTEPQNGAGTTYTPNLGFKLAETEYGDLSVSVYTYARYLNQLGLSPTYRDAFGNIKSVQERQDFQLQKVQIKLLGWILDPKFRYFIYTWTSNATQGQGAQVVVAGNMNYTFNKYATLSAGITSLPGVRSTEGNFPFWLGVDSRMIADEFFRPSYTSGVWLKGQLTETLRYQAMLGNNLSTLGVSAARLDKGFNTFSGEIVWTPTGEYGMGFGDFENHRKLATRLAAHFTRSNETKESQPNSEAFENTQLRLSDGTVIFTPDLFGPGITINDARYQMVSFDGGIKYRGYSLEGEYYLRWLDNFHGTNTEGLARLFDHGFQMQASGMVVPRKIQLYAGASRINGQFGNPYDIRAGVNWFPWKNKVVRWNTEWLYLRNSPVGYSSVPFAVGGRGNVFHSTVELAF